MNSRALIERYVAGWKEGNIEKILSTTSDDCLIRESHGPIYQGRKAIHAWAEEWLSTGKITQWDISSFLENDSTAVFEWHFRCTTDKIHEFDGISIARIENGKITSMREYKGK